jgi:hypothetical protein
MISKMMTITVPERRTKGLYESLSKFYSSEINEHVPADIFPFATFPRPVICFDFRTFSCGSLSTVANKTRASSFGSFDTFSSARAGPGAVVACVKRCKTG